MMERIGCDAFLRGLTWRPQGLIFCNASLFPFFHGSERRSRVGSGSRLNGAGFWLGLYPGGATARWGRERDESRLYEGHWV